MTRKSLSIVTIVALCLAGPAAWAQARIDEVGEQLVNDFIDNVITLQGRFEQSLIDAEGIVQERSSGTLEIERPGRFRWSYFEPLSLIHISEPTRRRLESRFRAGG